MSMTFFVMFTCLLFKPFGCSFNEGQKNNSKRSQKSNREKSKFFLNKCSDFFLKKIQKKITKTFIKVVYAFTTENIRSSRKIDCILN